MRSFLTAALLFPLRLLALAGWDWTITGGRLWAPATADRMAATRLHGSGDGIALAFGRWELTVSPREYRRA